MLSRRTSHRGDTIIEVLIALTVLSLVLGINYALANRSLRSSREAQERSIASELAQSMVETVKAYAIEGVTPEIEALIFPASSTSLCISTAANDIASMRPPVVAPDDLCNQGFYTTRLEVSPVAGAVDPAMFEYTARVEWTSLANGQTSQVTMRYRWARL